MAFMLTFAGAGVDRLGVFGMARARGVTAPVRGLTARRPLVGVTAVWNEDI